MRFIDTIIKKRDGGKLTDEEIDHLVRNYVAGKIPDYQMSAFLMATYFNSLDTEETARLTGSMAESGGRLDLSSVEGFKVDKHSSGGVGDTVSLILVPLVRAVGLKIGKLSGRGLGHTGGTIDKLESIPGFRVNLSTEEFTSAVRKVGMAIMEHTKELVPADQKLYELRDLTGTVESLPLIISSIMSKKIACGPDGVVLDIKTGSGAFIKDLDRAEDLARGCVNIGKEVGLEVSALITDMNQPLGRAAGNSLEVKEALKVLRDESDGDLRTVTANLVGELLVQSGKFNDIEDALKLANDKIKTGAALKEFERLIESQDGDPRIAENPELLPESDDRVKVELDGKGYVTELDALKIGRAANILGAGRQKKGEKIDLSVGVRLEKRIGDKITSSEPVAWLHYNDNSNLAEAKQLVKDAFTLGTTKPRKIELIKGQIR